MEHLTAPAGLYINTMDLEPSISFLPSNNVISDTYFDTLYNMHLSRNISKSRKNKKSGRAKTKKLSN